MPDMAERAPNTWQNRAYNLLRMAGSCFWIANLKNEKEKLVLEKRLQEIRKLEMASMERSERKVRDAKQTLVEMRVSAEVHREHDLVNIERGMRERQAADAAAREAAARARKSTPRLLPQLRPLAVPGPTSARLPPSRAPTVSRRLSLNEGRKSTSISRENRRLSMSEIPDDMIQLNKTTVGIVKKNSEIKEEETTILDLLKKNSGIREEEITILDILKKNSGIKEDEVPILDILREQSAAQLEQTNHPPTRGSLPAIGSALGFRGMVTSAQMEERPRKKVSPKTSARRQGLPRECRNTFSFRKFMEGQVDSALSKLEKPEEKNKKKLQKLIMKEHERLPGIIQRRKSTSAIFRDFEQLRAHRRQTVSQEDLTRESRKCSFIKPQEVTDEQQLDISDITVERVTTPRGIVGETAEQDKILPEYGDAIVDPDSVKELKDEMKELNKTPPASPVKRLKSGAYIVPMMKNEPYLNAVNTRKDLENRNVEGTETQERPSRKRKSNAAGYQRMKDS